MRKRIAKVSLFLVGLGLVAAVAAPALAGGAGGHFRIVEVYLRTDGQMAYVIGDNGSTANPDGCGASGMYVIERETLGDEAFDRMVAQATAAMLGNKRVTTWLSGCSRYSYWGATRPVMWDFRVYRD